MLRTMERLRTLADLIGVFNPPMNPRREGKRYIQRKRRDTKLKKIVYDKLLLLCEMNTYFGRNYIHQKRDEQKMMKYE